MKMSDMAVTSSDVVARNVGGEMVLLNLAGGTYYGLNPVGGRIWQFLESESRTLADIHDMLLAEYDVSAQDAEKDLIAILADLQSNELLELVSA